MVARNDVSNNQNGRIHQILSYTEALASFITLEGTGGSRTRGIKEDSTIRYNLATALTLYYVAGALTTLRLRLRSSGDGHRLSSPSAQRTPRLSGVRISEWL